MNGDSVSTSSGRASIEWEAHLVDSLSILLSTVVISGINIAISGQLLGYVLGLNSDASDHFTLRIPYLFRLQAQGRQVAAGFASFSLSLLLVGLELPAVARRVFIDSLQATDKQWIACQGLAAIISVGVCLGLGAMRTSWSYYSAQVNVIEAPSPQERAANLIARARKER